MKKQSKMLHRIVFGLLATGVLSCSAVLAQETGTGPSTSFKETARDPFIKYRPPVKRKVEKKPAGLISPPSVQDRIAQYKAMKLAAMRAQIHAPKATTALLISEVEVMGVFRTPRGYAAMVEALPIKLSYVIYPGEQFFDGHLVAVEENTLVFRRETKWTDGRRDMAVVNKPLRQDKTFADPANASAAEVTATAIPSSNTPATPEANKSKVESASVSGNN